MSKNSYSGSDTDSVSDMPSGKWVVTDKITGTSEGIQNSQFKSKKSDHPTVNIVVVPQNTEKSTLFR